jgi:hypothetical protein
MLAVVRSESGQVGVAVCVVRLEVGPCVAEKGPADDMEARACGVRGKEAHVLDIGMGDAVWG